MTITEDLIAAGVKLRQRQEKAKAELEAERADQERLREERARAFWLEVDRSMQVAGFSGDPARIINWPRRETK